MLLNEQQVTTTLNFSHSTELPLSAVKDVWKLWSELSNWNSWDFSLKGTEASEDGLFLGKRFSVIPKSVPAAVPVTVTSFEEGRHFTTTSVSPMGILAFGHSLKVSHDSDTIILSHSICHIATDTKKLPDLVWNNFQADVCKSVDYLANVITQKGNT